MHLADRDITRLETFARARLGMGRTFQRLEVFGGMTVRENLQVAAEVALDRHAWRDAFTFRHRTLPEVRRVVDENLDLVGIRSVANELAGSLPDWHPSSRRAGAGAVHAADRAAARRAEQRSRHARPRFQHVLKVVAGRGWPSC